MGTAILITIIMVMIFGGMGAFAFFMIKKVDPKNQDESEKADITTAQEFLPFEDIANNMIILGNHRYRAVLSCTSTNYDLKTEAEREQLEMSFQRFLNTITFPLTFFMQTKIIDNTKRMQDLDKDIEATIQEWPHMASYAEQFKRDMENLSAIIGNNQQKKRYIIVTYDDAGALGTLSEDEKTIHAERELRQRCNGIIGNLQEVGIRADILKTEELIELIYSCYHRDDYSYSQAISDKEPFSLFVSGEEDKFKDLPKAKLLDLVLGEAINKIELSNLDSDIGGQKALDELKQIRHRYAGYFKEDLNEGRYGNA